MKELMLALHKQNLDLDKKYKFYFEKHSEFCVRFDELSEDKESSASDYQELCLALIDAFSDLYFFDKTKESK
jgi:hypothetical protein